MGRLLEPTDRRDGAGVTVVNETYARTYLDGRILSAAVSRCWAGLGVRVELGGQLAEQTVDEAEIVGVIPDIKQVNLQDRVQPAIYLPHEQLTMRKMAIIVRSETDDPAALIPAIRRELAAMDSTIPARLPFTPTSSPRRWRGTGSGRSCSSCSVVVSLTLAAVGTYGLISFSVNQRFNEIAVRSAFGAERANLLGCSSKRALQLAGIGIVLGVGGAIAMRQVVASQLYEVSALDPWVLAVVPLTMLAVTAVASYLPARRASRIDVTAALREN